MSTPARSTSSVVDVLSELWARILTEKHPEYYWTIEPQPTDHDGTDQEHE